MTYCGIAFMFVFGSQLWWTWIGRPWIWWRRSKAGAFEQPAHSIPARPGPPVMLSPGALEEYDRNGYLVVRGVFPREVAQDLYRIVKALPQPPLQYDEQGEWIVNDYNRWMDVDALAAFVFRQGPVLGSIAAQLLNATTIRYAAEAFKGIDSRTGGHKCHIDMYSFFQPVEDLTTTPPGRQGLVRLFMPLGQDVGANGTGGSLFVLPIPEFNAKVRGSAACQGVTFNQDGRRARECHAEFEALMTFAPDLALGDVLLYSPNVAHRTQPIRAGERISYVANLYDPSSLSRLISGPPLSRAERWHCKPVCWDRAGNEYDYNFYFQSPGTLGVGGRSSACTPQLHPGALDREVQARTRGQLVNYMSRHAGHQWRVFRYGGCPLTPEFFMAPSGGS